MIVDIEQPTLEGDRPRPIRGWLILIAVVLILTLVRLGWGLLHAIDALDAAGWNPAVVRDGIDDGTVFMISVTMTAVLFAWWLTATVLFLHRSRRFPSATMTLLVSWVILTLGQMVLFRVTPTLAFAIQMLMTASLGSYLRRSKRVKATFVR